MGRVQSSCPSHTPSPRCCWHRFQGEGGLAVNLVLSLVPGRGHARPLGHSARQLPTTRLRPPCGHVGAPGSHSREEHSSGRPPGLLATTDMKYIVKYGEYKQQQPGRGGSRSGRMGTATCKQADTQHARCGVAASRAEMERLADAALNERDRWCQQLLCQLCSVPGRLAGGHVAVDDLSSHGSVFGNPCAQPAPGTSSLGAEPSRGCRGHQPLHAGVGCEARPLSLLARPLPRCQHCPRRSSLGHPDRGHHGSAAEGADAGHARHLHQGHPCGPHGDQERV